MLNNWLQRERELFREWEARLVQHALPPLAALW
jgi:hypothetical protein